MQKTEPSLSSMRGMVFEILYLFPMSEFGVNVGKMKTIILLVLSRYFHLKMMSQKKRNPTEKDNGFALSRKAFV